MKHCPDVFTNRMRISFIATVVLAVFVGCSQRDSIDRLMDQAVPKDRLGSSTFTPIDLPVTASPEQLLSALSKRGNFRTRQVESFKIVKIRKMQSGPNNSQLYTVVLLLDTNAGTKIVVLQPESFKDGCYGWNWRIYDVK